MKSVTSLTALLLASLASVAQAGQRFTFQDPISSGSYVNSMFQTVGLTQGNGSPAAALLNLYTGTVPLVVDNFSFTGDYLGSSTVTAKYFLSRTTANQNDIFSGPLTSGTYATGAGQVTFVNPANTGQVYFAVAFTRSALSYPFDASGAALFGTFAAAQTLTFSGNLFNTTETGNPNASFSFPDLFTSSGSPDHHTGSFTASIGTIGTINVTPEPTSMVALGAGAFALLRRRRRA